MPLAERTATRLGNHAECVWRCGWTDDDRYSRYALIRPGTGDDRGLKLRAREFDLPAHFGRWRQSSRRSRNTWTSRRAYGRPFSVPKPTTAEGRWRA